MKNLEINKIAAAILISGLVMALAGQFANFLYGKTNYQLITPSDGGSTTASIMPTEQAIDVKKVLTLIASGDKVKGAMVSKKCMSCHNLDRAGANKIGPHLYGVVNRPIASISDFNYSSSMKDFASNEAKKGEGTWTNENLIHFISNPKNLVSGTKMTFVGIKDEQDLANLIAYLDSNHD